ncbi:synemin [Thalassophryne amazonica]|uniref:synemin n=1 Tax=Thalassophryne amazonica TaxID=390379 RepID=UPI0014718838|nr:synemin [Thalassophryne amazonica]
MLPFKRTFESEKEQLQELNTRLAHYLSRSKQLEQENARLIAEIKQLRQTRAAECEPQFKAEMRQLRRTVDQLSVEKSQAEMEREKLWQELQMVQGLRSQQTQECKDISGELKGCEHELHCAHQANRDLQQRLFQLENQYKQLEETHRQQVQRLQRQVESRAVTVVTQTPPAAASLEEVQQYARGVSAGWVQTFDMYQKKLEEMEQRIKDDQARLNDLHADKMLYASELGKLRAEAERQSRIQMRLEEELMHAQEKFGVDLGEHQMIIEELERERNMMADTIAEKLHERQQLLQVKMDLGLEVAAYRALLEGERASLQDSDRRPKQPQRQRIIDIKMPAQPYSPRASSNTRQQVDIRYTQQSSNLRRSPLVSSRSLSPSRVIPISVAGRVQQQSPASRRDMISFAKAQAAASASLPQNRQMGQNENQMCPDVVKPTEEKIVIIKQVSQAENKVSPIMSTAAENKPERVVSSLVWSKNSQTETESKVEVTEGKEKGNLYDGESTCKDKPESPTVSCEKKILDSVSVEEVIEKVIKPPSSDQDGSSGESKVTCHMEKTEQEDGTAMTQILLESKMEEELDVSQDSTLDDLLSQEVKKVSLEDIKVTATGSMIQTLLSGLDTGENLQNKTVKVEIIEEPVETHIDVQCEAEHRSESTLYEQSSTYYQIEEQENIPDSQSQRCDDEPIKTFVADESHSMEGSVQIQEISRESESPYFCQEQESHEYFISTPDENLSDVEEDGGITSSGHFGIVDDLSDERYYEDGLPQKRMSPEVFDEWKLISSDHTFVPECIIEEEIHVSPTVQESVLELLREDSLEPKEQLTETLEKIQDAVSGPLKEELAYLTKLSRESPDSLAVDVKRVQQSSDNGTTTIVAELNVSQTLEDSGLLDMEDLSEEQIMAALSSSPTSLDKVFQGGAGGYTLRVSKDDVPHSEGDKEEHTADITDKQIKLEPSGKPFTFQMDVHSSQVQSTAEPLLQTTITETPLKISHEKKIATVYLESPPDD